MLEIAEPGPVVVSECRPDVAIQQALMACCDEGAVPVTPENWVSLTFRDRLG
jgi:hypothetical protein